MKSTKLKLTASKEKTILVQLVWDRMTREQSRDSLEELEHLADTAGVTVVGAITQHRDRPSSHYFIGEGKAQEVQLACQQAGANVVIFDNELTPVQVNNLDLKLGVKVIDRTELILQIFARRARSSEAQIQVELAQLKYLVSRLPVSEKQARFGGGFGMRGPGESPLNLRNAPMRRRIRELQEKLDAIQDRRKQARSRRAWPLVALVGYTNAGKSTLLTALTSAETYVDDRLFATLDTKTRLVHLPVGRDILLTDTVGFIRNLPHGLVASFRSTLDEVCEADLLLHVADASHSFVTEHCEVVFDTLRAIGADKIPYLLLLNKSDRANAVKALPELQRIFPDAVPISAITPAAMPGLKAMIGRQLAGKPSARSTP